MFEIVLKKIELLTNKCSTLFYKYRFRKFGSNSVVRFGCILNSPNNIEIGKNVYINKYVWLNSNDWRKDGRASLIVGDGTYIGRFSQINAFQDVVIENNVLIADNVYFGDVDHGIKDKKNPIKNNKYEFKGPILIKEGSFICRNAIISAGTTIGKNSIVAPGAYVIQKVVPDHSMAIGNPSRIVKI